MPIESTSKSSQKTRFLLTILLVVLTIGAFFFLSFVYIKNVNDFIAQAIDLTMKQVATQVRSWVDIKSTTVSDTSKAAISFRQSPDDLLSYMKRLLSSDSDFLDLYFGTMEPSSQGGFFLDASGWKFPKDFDWTQRPWFVAAMQTDNIIITKPFVDASTGRLVCSIARRVFNQGKVLGVVSSDILLSTVNEMINRARVTKNSVLYLVDADGQYLTNTILEKIGAANFFSEHNDYRSLLESDRLTEGFRVYTSLAKNDYAGSVGLQRGGWFIVVQGVLSDFHNTARTIISLAGVLLVLIGMFIFLLVRSWRSYMKLQSTSDQLQKANEGLEQTVEDRTSNLRGILDNTGEGFFTFGASLAIDPGYSRGCSSIFGMDIAGLNVAEVLFPGRSELADSIRQGFELYFKGMTKAEIIFDLSEKTTIIKDKIVAIDYKEIGHGKILCILKDITLLTQVEERSKHEAEKNRRLLRALQHKHFFIEYLETADKIFTRLDASATRKLSTENLRDLLRIIHTFKGDSGFFGFTGTQESANDAETLLSSLAPEEAASSFKQIGADLRHAFYKEAKAITDVMGEKWTEEANAITIPRDVYRKIVAYVQAQLPGEVQLRRYLDYYRKMPIKELFSRMPYIAANSADKLGKQIEPMIISGDDVRVLPERFQGLLEASIHIINNMVDHGIEYAYEREALHKPPKGRLELSISSDKSNLTLEFRDDGKGINPREVERKARAVGLIKPGTRYQNQEMLNLVFEDGFSTRAEVSSVSGRGIGLSAVKREVEKLGGTIEVRSKLGRGSSFEINVPLVASSRG